MIDILEQLSIRSEGFARDAHVEITRLRAENERLTVERDELKAALSRVAEQREEYLSQRDAAISENESLRREVLGDE